VCSSDLSGKIENVQSRWSISTGTLQKSGSIRVKLSAEQINLPYKLLIDGPMALKDGVLGWSGNFTAFPLRGDALARARDASEPLEAKVEGKFLATPKRVEVPEYRLEVGSREDPYTVTGSGGIEIQENVFFNLLADGRQIDLDRMDGGKGDGKPVPLEKRLAVMRSILERIPVPTIDGRISIELPAILSGDTLIRKVSTVVRPVEAGWNVQSFKAILPGNTVLEARGRLDLFDDYGFNGRLLLASRQPSGLAAWATGTVDPAIRRLRNAGMEATVTLSPHQISFDDLELVLDDAVLKGSIQRLSIADERPGIITALEGENVNIDDLRALYALTQGGREATFSNHDVDFKLKTARLEGKAFGQKLSADDVDLHLRVQEGSLSIEKLNSSNFFGAAFSTNGRITNLLEKPHGNIKLTLATDNGAQLAGLIGRLAGEIPVLTALSNDGALSAGTKLQIELDARAEGEGSRGQALVTGVVGGTDVNIRIGFDGQAGKLKQANFDITSKISNQKPQIGRASCRERV